MTTDHLAMFRETLAGLRQFHSSKEEIVAVDPKTLSISPHVSKVLGSIVNARNEIGVSNEELVPILMHAIANVALHAYGEDRVESTLDALSRREAWHHALMVALSVRSPDN